MKSADWSIVLGIITFIIAICFATYYYLKYKKISIVVFCLSIATYIFAVFYAWDVFELNKNWILLMLTISTIIMIFIGKYLSNMKFKPSKTHTSLKQKNEEN